MIEQSVTNSLRGSLGETLLRAHKGAIDDALQDRLLEILDGQWIPDGEYHTTFRVKATPHSYDTYIDGNYASWRPDALYAIEFTPNYRESSFERYEVEFPAEIKTGEYAELSDNQRAVMEAISEQSPPVVPVRARVYIEDLPDAFQYVVSPITTNGTVTYSPDDETPTPPAQQQATQTEISDHAAGNAATDGTAGGHSQTVPDDVVELLLADGQTTRETLIEETDLEPPRIDDLLQELILDGTVYESAAGVYEVVHPDSSTDE